MNATTHDAPLHQTPRHDINPVRERLIALRRLAGWFAERTGERVHRSAPYRWTRRGVRGVRLPTIQMGGMRYTSEEAIAWWTGAIEGRFSDAGTVTGGLGNEVVTVAGGPG